MNYAYYAGILEESLKDAPRRFIQRQNLIRKVKSEEEESDEAILRYVLNSIIADAQSKGNQFFDD